MNPRLHRAMIASPKYRDAVMALNPAGYWRLGEASWTVARDETGALAGTYANTPTLGVTGALSGDADTAVTLNGTTQYVTVPHHASLSLGDVFTLCAWVNKSGSGYRGILGKGTGAYYMRIDAADTISLLSANTALIATTTAAVSTGWHQSIATKNVTAVHLYIDGVDLADTTTTAVVCGNTALDLVIGREVSSGLEPFAGSLDEVAIWNRVLTASEIARLHQIGRGF